MNKLQFIYNLNQKNTDISRNDVLSINQSIDRSNERRTSLDLINDQSSDQSKSYPTINQGQYFYPKTSHSKQKPNCSVFLLKNSATKNLNHENGTQTFQIIHQNRILIQIPAVKRYVTTPQHVITSKRKRHFLERKWGRKTHRFRPVQSMLWWKKILGNV